MKIDDLSSRWSTVPPAESSFQRVDEGHPLDIFLGKSGENKKELMIICDSEPARMTSSKSLDIQKGIRKDGKWAIRIQLIKAEEEEVFTHLCWDLIEHARKASTKKQSLEILTARFLKWQKLMEHGSEILSNKEIKGVVGELLYAQNYLSQKLDWDVIISAWRGPAGADKDFVFYNTWSEVKSIASGKSVVTISSLEQLSSEKEGLLVVMYIDETSSTDSDGFSFASLIDQLRKTLDAYPSALLEFESKLLDAGYSERQEYSEKYYIWNKTRFFTVKSGFPRLEKAVLPHGIIKAKYDVLIPEIEVFEKVD